ncbi:unnamed protein product [Caenorhabditis angaria]|uniref:Uncharacterized protein n=1 Tax=Caenorhabditis angaria TaxID=860376 RepID=A0A9P1IDS5_9PELO|nr:unnamed protein product [Caenorhabditis angaria]
MNQETHSAFSKKVVLVKECFFTMTLSPETLLMVLAIAMCSLLLLFSIAVVIVFHCCKVDAIQNLPQAMLERTRHSVNWARHSVFSHSHYDEYEEDCGRGTSPTNMLRPPPIAV